MTFDRVHEENGKWYFWDETDADRLGPYDTEAEARKKFEEYVKFLNGEYRKSEEDEQTMIKKKCGICKAEFEAEDSEQNICPECGEALTQDAKIEMFGDDADFLDDDMGNQ